MVHKTLPLLLLCWLPVASAGALDDALHQIKAAWNGIHSFAISEKLTVTYETEDGPVRVETTSTAKTMRDGNSWRWLQTSMSTETRESKTRQATRLAGYDGEYISIVDTHCNLACRERVKPTPGVRAGAWLVAELSAKKIRRLSDSRHMDRDCFVLEEDVDQNTFHNGAARRHYFIDKASGTIIKEIWFKHDDTEMGSVTCTQIRIDPQLTQDDVRFVTPKDVELKNGGCCGTR